MFFQYFKENPKVGVLLALFFVLVVILWAFVLKSRKAKNKENEDLIKKLKEENELRNEFAILTPKLAGSADAVRLFRGVSLGLQKRISDARDMENEFSALTDAQRMIYALSFVIEDGGEKPNEFFSANGSPLTEEAKKAVETILPAEAAEVFSKIYAACDPLNENVSFIPEEIQKLNEQFSAAVSADEIMRLGGEYIRKNLESFTA